MSLSPAMSTASAPVFEVIVARIRCWCTPWPSCTRLPLLSRMKGMSRLTASSRIAPVDGPKAVRSARVRKRSSSLGEVEALLLLDEVVQQAHGEPAGRQADLLVGVAVDDVVDAGAALDLARLSPALVVPGLLLQLQCDVLGHVPQPGALPQPLDEAAPHALGAGVVLQPGQQLDEPVGEAGQGVAGVAPRARRGRRRGGSTGRTTRCCRPGRRGTRRCAGRGRRGRSGWDGPSALLLWVRWGGT